MQIDKNVKIQNINIEQIRFRILAAPVFPVFQAAGEIGVLILVGTRMFVRRTGSQSP
jgi:hypothetical protein